MLYPIIYLLLFIKNIDIRKGIFRSVLKEINYSNTSMKVREGTIKILIIYFHIKMEKFPVIEAFP